jgi:hypothetical protein
MCADLRACSADRVGKVGGTENPPWARGQGGHSGKGDEKLNYRFPSLTS